MTKKKLKILFRTSGGKAPNRELGLGHIYRCINLARNLKTSKIFFLVEDYGGAKNIIKKNGFQKIFNLEKDIDLKSDIQTTKKIIKKEKIDVLILDKYKIRNNLIKELKKYSKIVLISDLKKIDYPVDLVINGYVGFENKIKKNKFGTKCLLGPSFQIIDYNFPKNPQKKPHYDLLATFGGYDEKNIAEILLQELLRFKEKIKAKIILGPVTKKTKKLKILAKRLDASVKLIEKTNNMLKEITDARIGICSGGITSYEFAALHKPFAIICQVKHQLKTAQEWNKRKIATNLGLFNNRTKKKIEQLLNQINENNFGKNFRVISAVGTNTKRITEEILKLQ